VITPDSIPHCVLQLSNFLVDAIQHRLLMSFYHIPSKGEHQDIYKQPLGSHKCKGANTTMTRNASIFFLSHNICLHM
jgi:hypothetical protein